jgi:hypothetical protein
MAAARAEGPSVLIENIDQHAFGRAQMGGLKIIQEPAL